MKKILTIAAVIAAITGCKQANKQQTAYQVDTKASKIEWKGSATDHFHVGSFSVTGKVTSSDEGEITGGDFTIPVSSIVDYDLPNPVRQTLLADLKSANFFDMALHPNTTFHITGVTPYNGRDTGAVAGANYILTGDFTMVGQTHPVSFPAKIIKTDKGLQTEAKFNLDRTKWGMKIYSDPKQKLYIYPNVNIKLNIKASKA